jgi:hypothetical protein
VRQGSETARARGHDGRNAADVACALCSIASLLVASDAVMSAALARCMFEMSQEFVEEAAEQTVARTLQ